MIKLVAFDLDGTIANTIPTCIVAFKEALKPYVHRELSEKDVIETFGLNEEGMIKQVLNEHREEALDAFYKDYEKMLVTYCPKPIAGIPELIEWLKEKSIIVTLITGKGEQSCAITLQHFGMENCFEKVETGSPVKNRKADAMNDMMKEYNLRPEEMVYIGDALSDITACREAGVRCLSAAWVAFPQAIPLLEAENKGDVFYTVEALQDFFKANIH